MEMHIGTLLFIISPCLSVNARPFFRFWSKFSLIRTSVSVSEEDDFGDLVRVERGEPSNSDWRYMCTQYDGVACELEIINNYKETVLFCWVDTKGILHHYSPINDGSIHDGSVSNSRLENTHAGHCFVCIKRSSKLPSAMSEIKRNDLLFLYRIQRGGVRHIIKLNRGKVDFDYAPLPSKSDMIDASRKPYKKRIINGFVVHYEDGVLDDSNRLFRNAFMEDIENVCLLLPQGALRLLQQNTHLWVNKTFTYGRKNKPIIAKGCCFHPKEGREWLESNGHSKEKCGGVEIYECESYLNDRHLWGKGGVLIHELSHAFHNKFCEDGFDCKEIQEMYNRAMLKKLYDAVCVHGKQGSRGKAKAYACTNVMEFWAELSTAYHWHIDETTEYNKWFPHNRFQLIKHDVESFLVLHKLWNKLY